MSLLIGIVVGIAAASVAAADPRDAVDRSQRLDTDALRDDAATNRLTPPSHPLQIAPPPAAPKARTERRRKSGANGGGSR
ncbi:MULTISPECIES: hypothetical protein [unclassified Bradyrhizobium]|uniref:hypothetical protein n=1 Tax=unclassified Bradyrhizobium TaxID=2631580 RepID=UPI00116010CF|nr:MULTISPECIES: hypothetical protein [unclassified Bradyrhizobium]MBB4377168.1 hypothetical protein [Bradyrhizobium sp. SBR1B]